MPSYTYPVAHPSGTLTTEQIHALLSNKNVLARRIATIADQKFIADWLLGQRLNAAGGGIFYETGEEIFAADASEIITPGSNYPKTVLTQGEIASAKTDKQGLATDITDEKISREGFGYVLKALRRLANTVIRDVDSRALAVIQSKVTDTAAASAAWATPGAVLETLQTQQAAAAEGGTGIDLSAVVLRPAKYAKLLGKFIDAGALPRETGNAAITGNLPISLYGFEFATSPHYFSDNPMFVDREQLGGMADEKIVSPEFASWGEGNVETASDRGNGNDKYEVRARRVTVPVVLEQHAGVTITGTNL